MRIALIQINPAINDPEANAESIIKAVRFAAARGAEFCMASLEALAPAASSCPLSTLEGLPADIMEDMGGALTGAPPLLIGDGKNTVLINGGMGAAIQDSFQLGCRHAHVFLTNPEEITTVGDCVAPGDLCVFLKNWPWHPGCNEKTDKNLQTIARRQQVWTAAVNLAGGRGQEVFGGGSLVCGPAGDIRTRGASFDPDIILVDLDETANSGLADRQPDEDDAQWQALVTGTHDFIRKNGAKKALVGLSGGMDSAFVACVAARAIGGENVLGVLMPSPYTSEASVTDALALAGNLGMPTISIPIAPLMEAFSGSLAGPFSQMAASENDLTFENLQARIRGVILMALANRGGGLVLNTGNKSEAAMGYSTLYGDTVGALAVIGDLFKTRIYELAKRHCASLIPRNIFEKAPSAELRPDQKDTDSLPPYETLDPLLAMLFMGEADGGHKDELTAMAQRIRASSFKRKQCPPALLVGGWKVNCL